jgi:hypothetical protein
MTIPRANRVQLSYSGNLTNLILDAPVISGFTGYSVAVESLYIYVTDSIYNIGNGMALDVSLGTNNQVWFPNITSGLDASRSQVFARVPLNSAVTLPPPQWEDGGFVAYQNPCPYESRTKMILKLNDVDNYILGILTTSRGDEIICNSCFITLIFYDESSGNDFIPPGWV